MNSHRRARYLQALQIPQWSRRKVLQVVATPESLDDHIDASNRVDVEPVVEEQASLAPDIQHNKSVVLPEAKSEPVVELEAESASKTPVVESVKETTIMLQGQGNPEASCIVLGHVAVAEESDNAFSADEQVLLVNMLKAIELTPNDVFMVKPTQCLGSALRDPQQSELDACREYLLAHIRQINPAAVFVMNQLTAQILLQTEQTLAQLRENQHEISGLSAKLIVSYAPAHLLKRTQDKAKAWQDLKQLRYQLQQG